MPETANREPVSVPTQGEAGRPEPRLLSHKWARRVAVGTGVMAIGVGGLTVACNSDNEGAPTGPGAIVTNPNGNGQGGEYKPEPNPGTDSEPGLLNYGCEDLVENDAFRDAAARALGTEASAINEYSCDIGGPEGNRRLSLHWYSQDRSTELFVDIGPASGAIDGETFDHQDLYEQLAEEGIATRIGDLPSGFVGYYMLGAGSVAVLNPDNTSLTVSLFNRNPDIAPQDGGGYVHPEAYHRGLGVINAILGR